jgi:hypothetical protein
MSKSRGEDTSGLNSCAWHEGSKSLVVKLWTQVTMLELPYSDGGNTSMLVILPDANTDPKDPILPRLATKA